MSASPAQSRVSPELIVLCGCLIALITFGPRASSGLFQLPMITEYGWGRDTFGLAIAVQNLLWGVGQPFAGAVADRFGAFRVLCAGALLYALGLVVMAYATTPGMLQLGAGVLIGFGLSGARSTWCWAPSASCCRSSGGPWPSGPERRRAPSASSCSRPSATC
jgi:MFS family permease